MDNLQIARFEAEQYRKARSWRYEGQESELSPSGNFRLIIDRYESNEKHLSGRYVNFEIIDKKTNTSLIKLAADDYFFHAWIPVSDKEYLACSEFRGGQTIIELPRSRVKTYCPPQSEFIWCEFFPSKSRMKLAVIGCYWACPFEVAIYDFSDPLNLPLPLISQVELDDNNEQFGGWMDEYSFKLVKQDGDERVVRLNE